MIGQTPARVRDIRLRAVRFRNELDAPELEPAKIADVDRAQVQRVEPRLVRRRPLVKESARLEREIADLESEKRALEARLGDQSFYTSANVAEVQAATRRAAETARLLAAAEDRWLEVQSELEAIGEP